MPYRTAKLHRDHIEETLEKLQRAGNIEPASGPWGSPVIVVRHKSGKLRMCVDYRKLNAVTETEFFPLPPIEDVLAILGGKTYFSTIDLCQGFHQVRIHPDDKIKTTMSTHKGTFQWNVMPFGLKNAPAHFSRVMDLVLSGLSWQSCRVFIDDIIVFSNNFVII